MGDNLNRIAYIIGNNTYQNLDILQGAVNDAYLVEETLKQCGFKTNLYTNLNYIDFRSKINEFKYKCMEYHVGLFYYAGHGFEYKGDNYLCPIDSQIDCIENTNINITGLVNQISKDRGFVSILILDCCRSIYISNNRGINTTNPIIPNFKNTGGTFVAYATTSGESACEIDGHGLYTKLLCDNILTSETQIEQIFKNVRKEIIDINTSKKNELQIPWEYSSLVSEFYFIEKKSNDSIITLAKEAIEKGYSYNKIKIAVQNFCKNNNLSEKEKVLLDVLIKIDETTGESLYA